MAEKIKVVMYFSLALLSFSLALYGMGMSAGDLTSSGGRSGLFYIALSIMASIVEPVFNDNSVSVIYSAFGVRFSFLFWITFRKINTIYKFH